ncbi:MAG: BACON domain-containing protein [Bacteroidaceae bacterium]|nr:BACON domain-containing protein [Bacteroidaceae bacterium]
MKHTFHLHTLVCALLASLLFANCKEEKIDPYIELKSVSAKGMPSQGGDIDIQFFSAKEWTATADQSWVTITPSTGKGGTIDLKVNVHENTTPGQRLVKITLSSETVQQFVSITQKQMDSLSVSTADVSAGANDTRFTIDIDTNVESISTTSSAPWVKYLYKGAQSRAMKGYTLTFSMEKNNSFEARQALVTITGSDIRHEVKVVQEGRVDSTFVYIHHTNPVFTIPRISGDRVVGFVNWGDGLPQEEYQTDLAHTYSTGQQEHRVTLKVWGAEEIELPTIQGVTEVDLSEF